MNIDLTSVDVEDLLHRLDLKNVKVSSNGQEVNFSCFGAEHSHGDASPSAYINVEKKVWMCQGCKRAGTALSLVVEAMEVTQPEAEHMLRDWYGIQFNEPLFGSMAAETSARFRIKEPEPEPVRPERHHLHAYGVDWLGKLCGEEPYEQYMLDRGLSPEILDATDVGYDFLSDRVTIPVFTLEGDLIGFKARDWTGQRQPKYRILGDMQAMRYGFDPYQSSEVVYGLHHNREHRTVVVVEGELDRIALLQMGVPRPVATGMSYMSERHVQLIAQEAERVIFYYDAGTAGNDGTWGRRAADGKFRKGGVQLLEPYVQVSVAQALEDDPNELLRTGRGDEALAAIENATSSLARHLVFR